MVDLLGLDLYVKYKGYKILSNLYAVSSKGYS